MMIARLSLLNSLPRLASMAPFLCLIVAQWECPDMAPSLNRSRQQAVSSRQVTRTRLRTADCPLPTADFILAVLRLRFQKLELLLDFREAIIDGPAPAGIVQIDG